MKKMLLTVLLFLLLTGCSIPNLMGGKQGSNNPPEGPSVSVNDPEDETPETPEADRPEVSKPEIGQRNPMLRQSHPPPPHRRPTERSPLERKKPAAASSRRPLTLPGR